jgi:hypothetical protein
LARVPLKAVRMAAAAVLALLGVVMLAALWPQFVR